MGPLKSHLNDKAIQMENFDLPAKRISEMIQLIKEGKIANSKASQELFPIMVTNPSKTAQKLAEENQLIQESNSDALLDFVQQAIAKFPDKAEAYKKGKKNLLGLFMGEVMKLSKGKADPKVANQIIREQLEK